MAHGKKDERRKPEAPADSPAQITREATGEATGEGDRESGTSTPAHGIEAVLRARIRAWIDDTEEQKARALRIEAYEKAEREYQEKLDALMKAGDHDPKHYEEAADLMREHHYGYDPGPILPENLSFDDEPTVAENGDSITVRIWDTVLGSIQVTIDEKSEIRRSLEGYFTEELAKEAADRLVQGIVQQVRDMTSRAWSTAIEETRETHPGEAWRVGQIEDVFNEGEPFWPRPPNRPPLSRAELVPVLREARWLRWKLRKEGATLDARSKEFRDQLRQRLIERGVFVRGRVPGDSHLREILDPATRKTPRLKSARSAAEDESAAQSSAASLSASPSGTPAKVCDGCDPGSPTMCAECRDLWEASTKSEA